MNLPKGLRVDHGYLQVRIQHDGQTYCRNFGKVSPKATELAIIHLSKKREEILLGKFGYKPEIPSKQFRQVADIYYNLWSKETTPEGLPRHTQEACSTVRRVIDKSLVPVLGARLFDDIKPKDVQTWRDQRVKHVLGTSANREQDVLSSIFGHIETWVKAEKIEAFKLPPENPCPFVERSKMRKRERIPTDYELKKLKLAAFNRTDPDAWEIIKMALKSILSEKDLRNLEIGSTIDLRRAKTGQPIHIPITVLQKLNFKNWRKRWEAIKTEAGCPDIQFRDLRKKGGNHLVGRHDTKLVSQYHGHASVRTTEEHYTLLEHEKMRPLAEDLENWVDGL